MFNTWFQKPSIPANSVAWSPNDVPLVRARTVTITVRLKYHASATGKAICNVYYSPDGKHYDTVPIDYFDIDLSAGEVVQETGIIAVPEHGYFKVAIQNTDTNYPITDVMVWYTIQSWAFRVKQEAGTIEKDVGEA